MRRKILQQLVAATVGCGTSLDSEEDVMAHFVIGAVVGFLLGAAWMLLLLRWALRRYRMRGSCGICGHTLL